MNMFIVYDIYIYYISLHFQYTHTCTCIYIRIYIYAYMHIIFSCVYIYIAQWFVWLSYKKRQVLRTDCSSFEVIERYILIVWYPCHFGSEMVQEPSAPRYLCLSTLCIIDGLCNYPRSLKPKEECLGNGFKLFNFLPLPREMIQFD